MPVTNAARATGLVLVALAFPALAVRSSDKDVGEKGRNWSPWSLSYKGLQCMQLDPAPFPALTEHWPKCVNDAVAKAEKLGKVGNCRLCDVDFAGSKPEAQQGYTSTGCSAKVTCSALRLGSDEKTCFGGHGKVGAVKGLNDSKEARSKNPAMACLPCTEGCKECGYVGNMVTGASRQFKCVMRALGTPETGVRCETPSGFTCGKCKHRTCSGMFNFCDKKDFKSDCEFPSTYQQPTEDQEPPEDYELTLQAGGDRSQQPPVLSLLYSGQ